MRGRAKALAQSVLAKGEVVLLCSIRKLSSAAEFSKAPNLGMFPF